MALDLGTLVGYLMLDSSDYDKALDTAQSKTSGFASSAPAWMAAASAAIVASAVAIGGALFAMGSEFDDVRDNFEINTTASGAALQDLMDTADDVASKVPVSIGAAGDAVATLSQRLGLSGDDLETVAQQALQAGHMMKEELDFNALTGSMNVFGVANDQVSGKLDYLFQVSQATGIGMNDLMAQVQSAGPITQQLGMTFEDTAAMIGVMDRAGLNSQSMISAMQRGLINMSQPGEDAQTTFKRVTDEIQGFIDKGDMAAARAAAGEMFGTRGAAQLVGALQTGAISFDDLAASAGLSGDSILDVASKTADFGETWQTSVNQAMIALQPVAEGFFGFMSDALAAVAPAAVGAFEWIGDNMGLIKTFGIILGSFAAAWLIVTAALAAYNAVQTIMKAVTAAGTVVQWAMNVAMAANPVGLVVLAVMALILVIVLLATHWDEVIGFITGAWEGFVGWFTGVMDGFLGWWGGVWDGFVGFASDTWNGFVGWITDGVNAYIQFWVTAFTALGQFWSEVWTGIVDFFVGLWEGYMAWLTGVIAGFVGFWTDVWNGVSSFFSALWSGVVAAVTSIWSGYMTWIRSVVAGFVSFWVGVWTGISTFFSGLWSGIVGFVTDAWGNIMAFLGAIPGKILAVFSGAAQWLWSIGRDIINGLWNGLKSIWGSVTGWIGSIGQKVIDMFKNMFGIHSPSTVFRAFGINIGEGLIEGLADIQPEIDANVTSMIGVPPGGPTPPDDRPPPGDGGGRHYHVHMEASRSTLDEEAIFEALGSARVP